MDSGKAVALTLLDLSAALVVVVREAVWSHNLYGPQRGRIDFVTIQPSDFKSRTICVRGDMGELGGLLNAG